MSFSGMRKSIARWIVKMCRGGLGTTALGLIGTMSFQLAIPRQVALPQSLSPLHQPRRILQESAQAVQLNCSER